MRRCPGAEILSRHPAHAGLDEDDVRVRPGRGTRPRTRRRPAHEDAAEGFVTSVDRGRYGCLTGGRTIIAMKARELGRRSVVVGDRVALAGDSSGGEGTLARIVRVRPRASALRRSADDTDPVERVIVANAEQLVIVCALAQPPPRLRFIDRCLVAAYDAGISPLLCLTKADLAPPREVLEVYEPLGLPCLVTRRPLPPAQLGELRAALAGRISVLVGQSGVGKSTLVNALIPDADRAVGTVNPVTGRGRHTSSSAVALGLPDGGWIIDTPGLRGFGLGHVTPQRVVAAFSDLAEGTRDCPPGCDHRSDGCALDDWARAHGAEARLDSLRRLLRSLEGETVLARGGDPPEPPATRCGYPPAQCWPGGTTPRNPPPPAAVPRRHTGRSPGLKARLAGPVRSSLRNPRRCSPIAPAAHPGRRPGIR